MLTRLRHLRRDERGMSFVYVAMGFMAFLSATTLAIDVGMFMTGRTQAQTSADSGALSGATALVFNSWDDRTSSGPAVQSALSAARSNQVIANTVSVNPSDVTFPLDPAGNANRVKVDVFRTASRGNPVPTLMGRLFGVTQADIVATATAEASAANAVKCPLPFTIPDKWEEKQDPTGWTPDSTFDIYDNKGNPVGNPDVYIPATLTDPGTGYRLDRDYGLEIVLKASNDTKITSSFYNPWDLPGKVGADDYREAIATCDPNVVTPNGIDMPPENGNMVGPTAQGMQDLIDQDPGAHWEDNCPNRTDGLGCVVGSDPKFKGVSPRVRPLPVYDPVAMAEGQQHGKNITLKNVKYLGFFIEPLMGGEVRGRFVSMIGTMASGAAPAPPGSFPVVIRLVQ
jgi:Flp pilus assembly protein TadG